VYAPNSQVELDKKREAFFNIELFKKVHDYYGGSKLPETKYLSNTLENEFGLVPDIHDEFTDLFRKNCEYLGIDEAESDRQSPAAGNGLDEGHEQQNSDTIVLAAANKADAKEVFVIMPFSERHEEHPEGFFQEVLASLITPAASEAGFSVRTARRSGSDVIQATIVQALVNADLVIADLTEHNPNVLFELGVRMALDKPVLLIRAKGTDKIFDVDNMLRVFDYRPNLWPSTLKHDVPELQKHIEAGWDAKQDKTYMQILGVQ
jgi:hypothetical protein